MIPSILRKAICTFNIIPIKLPMAFFTELGQNFKKFVWKYKRPQIAKIILRKKNGARGIKPPDFTIIQSNSHQNSVVLAEKQTYRSLEQDRKHRNKPMHIWSFNLSQRR